MARIIPIEGFRLFDSSIDIILNFEFWRDVDNIEIKPALVWAELTLLFLDTLM